MTTIYLRFVDRAQALSVLGAVLGFDGTQGEDGRQVLSCGVSGGVCYHLCFLADAGVAVGAGEDHVNLLWPDETSVPPDLDAYAAAPGSPSCVFAGSDQLNQ